MFSVVLMKQQNGLINEILQELLTNSMFLKGGAKSGFHRICSIL